MNSIKIPNLTVFNFACLIWGKKNARELSALVGYFFDRFCRFKPNLKLLLKT